MTKTFHGKVHGQTIHINEDLNLADGEDVEVVLRPTTTPSAWGEGIRRSAGAAADIPNLMTCSLKSKRNGRRPVSVRQNSELSAVSGGSMTQRPVEDGLPIVNQSPLPSRNSSAGNAFTSRELNGD
jgi:hypothetical protein